MKREGGREVVRKMRTVARNEGVGVQRKGEMRGKETRVRGYHVTREVKAAAKEWEGVEKEVLSMPALSPSMTEGNIVKWSKKVGDKISAGDVIAEVETDKATVAFEATEDGFLAKILKDEGSKAVPVSEPIAIVVSKKDLVSKFESYVHEQGGSSTSQSHPSSSSSSSSSNSSSSNSSSSNSQSSTSSTAPSVPHNVLPMPSLSPTMEDGVIVAWKKKEGDKINAGDVLADVETDKATVAFEATEDGYLAKILQPAGAQRIKVNVPVAIVVDKKSDIEAVKDYNPGLSSSGGAQESKESSSHSSPSSTSSSTSSTSTSSTSSSHSTSDGRVIASPYAKLLSKEKNVPLQQINGSGPNGRIIAADVLSFKPTAESQKVSAGSKATSSSASTESIDFTDTSISNIRRVTAQRLTQSKQTVPHFYLTVDVQVDELMKVRETLNRMATAKASSKPGSSPAYKLSVNDFVVKASAMAMRQVPAVNSQWMGDAVRQYHAVDINVAVSTDAGLYTPIVRDADLHGLQHISSTVKSASAKAAEGKLTLAELATGTFTISNLGMLGIDHFAAVINPPQAAILAVGKAQAKVVPASKPTPKQPFAVLNFMTVTLSCDHRVVDGAVGAQWLQSFKDLIENPMKLLL